MEGFLKLLAARPEGDAASQFAAWTANSTRVAQIQTDYQRQIAALWMATVARQRGEDYKPVISPERADRRFAAADWRDNPYFDYLKQTYLLNARFVTDLVEAAEVDSRTKHRLRFFARQFVDAMSPANFAATNPEALKLALETKGESLARGHAPADRRRRTRAASPPPTRARSRSDGTSRSRGRGGVRERADPAHPVQAARRRRCARAAAGDGAAVHQQVLHPRPRSRRTRSCATRWSRATPCSWSRGATSPTELGHLTWDDYLRDGVLKALEVAREIAGAERVNALGFCVGGTMLGVALAVLAARGEDLVESATFLTSMLDFSDAGEIGLFVDEASCGAREAAIGKGGVMPGRDLAMVFSALRVERPRLVVRGQQLSEGQVAGRVRHPLLERRFAPTCPGPCTAGTCATPTSRTACACRASCGRAACASTWARCASRPTSSRRARTTSCRGRPRTTRRSSCAARSASCSARADTSPAWSIPAAKGKRSFWTNENLPSLPDDWLAHATEHAGSWWPDWDRWLERFAQGEVAAPAQPGNATYLPIEDAPGRYVKFRVV